MTVRSLIRNTAFPIFPSHIPPKTKRNQTAKWSGKFFLHLYLIPRCHLFTWNILIFIFLFLYLSFSFSVFFFFAHFYRPYCRTFDDSFEKNALNRSIGGHSHDSLANIFSTFCNKMHQILCNLSIFARVNGWNLITLLKFPLHRRSQITATHYKIHLPFIAVRNCFMNFDGRGSQP